MKKETKIITQNWGEINPKKIGDYLKVGGYETLKNFVKNPDGKKAVAEIKLSGLQGRGGAGFSMGKKMECVFNNKVKEKYFVCNFDESEPGTFKDRLIVENNPHLVLEGIILASLIVGAQKAIIYINGHYEKAKEILEMALEQAQEKNFWGEHILKTKLNLEIEIFVGAGAYICGEETALLNSLEGLRGEPKARPPYPVENGYLGKPTLINNVETVANVPWIIKNGEKKYAAVGSEKSPGTKLFTISGAVKNPGYFELPLGITLRELIFDKAGGMKKGKDFWFAQLGGASGRLLMEEDLDTKLEYSREGKFPLGSGAILVVDKSVPIWELLFSWSDFFARESCGKCIPCREGTFRMREIIGRFEDGEISERDKQALQDILWTLEKTCFCPFGSFAAVAIKDAIQKLKIF